MLQKIAIAAVIVAVIAGTVIFMKPKSSTQPMSIPPQVVVPLVQAPVVVGLKYKRDMLEDTETAVPVVVATPSDASGRPKPDTSHLAGTTKLVSSAFKADDKMPHEFTCYRKNISPPLSWSGAPANTKSYVVFFEMLKKDSESVAQWVAYNIASSINELPADLPKTHSPGNGVTQGLSDLESIGYAGPCQRKGEFRSEFTVYALDTELNAPPGMSRNDLVRAMNGHIVDMAKLPTYHFRRL
jgi:Raf kinase inhibitor-like YbhB/YbcL family protein